MTSEGTQAGTQLRDQQILLTGEQVDGGDGTNLEDNIEMENELHAIRDSCQRIATVINTLSKRAQYPLRKEAEQYVNQLKGQMIQFATAPGTTTGGTVSAQPDGSTPIHSTSGTSRPTTINRRLFTNEQASDPALGQPSNILNQENDLICASNKQEDADTKEVRRRVRKNCGISRVSVHRRNSSSDSSYDADTEEDRRDPPRRESRNRHQRTDHTLLQALQRLDNRTVPCPEPFDMMSGQSIDDFFTEFETYCTHTFRSHRNTWTIELGKFLTGELKDAFKALKGPNDRYDHIKDKIYQWYLNSREYTDSHTKAAFNDAHFEHHESLRLYSARLERLFKLARPKRDVNTSKLLQDKFMETVPNTIRTQLESAIGFSKMMTGAPLTWPRIVTFVSHLDLSSNKLASSLDTGCDIVYSARPVSVRPTLSQPKSQVRDASTQCTVQLPRQPYQSFDNPQRDSQIRDVNAIQDVLCTFCKRVGHSNEFCRRRLGLCLLCGDKQHKVAQCPKRATSSVMINAASRSTSSLRKSDSTRRERNSGSRQVHFADHYDTASTSFEQPDTTRSPLNNRALAWRGTRQS